MKTASFQVAKSIASTMDGCNTWEYQRFRSHKPVLNRIIIDDLTEVAEALHKEVLINDNNSRKARNQYTDAALRATELTQILSTIGLVVCVILVLIPISPLLPTSLKQPA